MSTIKCFLTLFMFSPFCGKSAQLSFLVFSSKCYQCCPITHPCLRLEITASEHLTEAQAGVLAEESWNAFFSVEVFMHKQVKGETGKYFRIFQHVKWNHSTLPSCPLHACLCWRAVRLGSTPANIIYQFRSDPKKYHIHLLFQEAKNMSVAVFIWKLKGNIQQILQSFSKWYSCNIRKVL